MRDYFVVRQFKGAFFINYIKTAFNFVTNLLEKDNVWTKLTLKTTTTKRSPNINNYGVFLSPCEQSE